METKMISLRVPVEIKEELERIARTQERSMSWIVKKAIQEYLERNKGE